MSASEFRYLPYLWRGQPEWMLVHGFKNSHQAIILAPLFEELNFTRTFTADIARALAKRGIGSWLPDLPGTGESLHKLSDIGWDDWRDAARIAGETVATATGSKPHIVALRGGALLSDAVDGRSRWSFAPVAGASLLRHLQRAQLISHRNYATQDILLDHEIFEYTGYELSANLRDGLQTAEPPASADRDRIAPVEEGAMLWRRAEPGRDRELSIALADDIAAWIASCDAR